MARFKRVLTSKEFFELKPYIKYLVQGTDFHAADMNENLEMLVKMNLIYRTPTLRIIGDRLKVDKQVTNLPKCLTV